MSGTPNEPPNGMPEDEDDVGDMIPFRADDPAPESGIDGPEARDGDRLPDDDRPQDGDGLRYGDGGPLQPESGDGPPAGEGPGAGNMPESEDDPQDRDEAQKGERSSDTGRSEHGDGPQVGDGLRTGEGPQAGDGSRAGEASQGGDRRRRGGGGEAEGVPPSAVRRRAVRKAGLVAGGLIVSLVALGAGAIAVLKPHLSPDDYEGTGSGAVTVRIVPGSTAEAIGSVLAEAGVVASTESFVRATEDRAVADRLRPGHYRLRKGMAASAALDLLLSPASRVVRRVTIPEGMRVSEVLTRLAKQAGLPLKELQNVDKALVGLPKYAPGLEGFLFPATYEIEPGDTAVDVLAAMVERFGVAARKVRLEERAARVHLTPLEAVTVASLIQAEGGTDDDYPKIARVIYNRLARGTKLEIDSTVLYAQNRRTLRVTENDTKVDHPYNTYRHKGLPPGPIANPGEKALIAALHPAKGDWHWFVTTDPAHRITKFTNKESEFVRYREELNKNLGAN
ncbi:endolytic transglycosylase MltG [Nonomuraea sp. SYSU D8015]|uniref:endolytic transglycosylase MltG n=1 Tax=Nonomuraea sp. SYSU D8015 TaxID=2593644 RepID=UPI001CB75491|nr:endolytic transglycosylase MltG [Nonomuraea sp. SYSU D8015]